MDLVNSAHFKESAASLQRLRDLALAATVRAALRNDERTRKIDITIGAAEGHVTLSGVADSSQSANTTADVAAATPGVSGVTNNIQFNDRPFRRIDG